MGASEPSVPEPAVPMHISMERPGRLFAGTPTLANLACLLAVVMAGDALFHGARFGLNVALFALAVTAAAVLVVPMRVAKLSGRLLLLYVVVMIGALIEEPSVLSLALVIVGLASFALAENRAMHRNALYWMQKLGRFFTHALFTGPVDAIDGVQELPRVWGVRSLRAEANGWLVPVGLSAAFIGLFSLANPVIADWLRALLSLGWSPVDLQWRVLLWLGIALIAWPLIRPVFLWPQAPAPWTRLGCVSAVLVERYLTPIAVLRGLILFNLVFAVQNGLDVQNLWGVAPPSAGMTLAVYAHASAYPLVASALLAGVFVILAFGPSDTAPSRISLLLMSLFVAQNVLLVVSSIERTLLYINSYALTYLRIAALIWMGLVAFGLVLIVLRVVRGKSNLWLINANTAALIWVLSVSAFIDFAAMIAEHNVRNAREMGGQGVYLDARYLRSIGPSVLPAMRRYSARTNGWSWDVGRHADAIEAELRLKQADWRSWTFRGHRILSALPPPQQP